MFVIENQMMRRAGIQICTTKSTQNGRRLCWYFALILIKTEHKIQMTASAKYKQKYIYIYQGQQLAISGNSHQSPFTHCINSILQNRHRASKLDTHITHTHKSIHKFKLIIAVSDYKSQNNKEIQKKSVTIYYIFSQLTNNDKVSALIAQWAKSNERDDGTALNNFSCPKWMNFHENINNQSNWCGWLLVAGSKVVILHLFEIVMCCGNKQPELSIYIYVHDDIIR